MSGVPITETADRLTPPHPRNWTEHGPARAHRGGNQGHAGTGEYGPARHEGYVSADPANEIQCRHVSTLTDLRTQGLQRPGKRLKNLLTPSVINPDHADS